MKKESTMEKSDGDRSSRQKARYPLVRRVPLRDNDILNQSLMDELKNTEQDR